MKKLLVAMAVFALMLGAAAADAAFTYQGVIKEVSGAAPSVKNRTIEFRIYSSPTGATPLWGRAYNVLLDENGLFNTAITDAAGSEISGVTATGLASILARNSGSTLYIGLTVDNSSGEISPRQALLAVPYAMHAADAARASGDFTVAGNTTLQGTLTVGGAMNAKALTATSLTVNGNITASTAGALSGYGTTPIGGIIMWSGQAKDIPDGWALCDGSWSNGRQTPNLKGRFIVGYDPGDGDYNSVGRAGGEKRHTLSVNEMPSHNHSTELHTVGYSASWNSQKEAVAHTSNYDNKNNGTVWPGTSYSGGNQAHENRPPYYTLCFIMRVK